MIKALSLLLTGLISIAGVTTPAQAQDAAAGQTKAAMCIGCHGIPGYQASFPQVYKVPKIAGQNAAYIVAALTSYKRGDRKHPTMGAVSVTLSDKDMADLAAYYETLGASSMKTVADTPAAAPAGDAAALLAKGACASCHGDNFNKPINAAYPKLAGQHADYLYQALRAYGITDHAKVGRANAIMGAQVKQFQPAELKVIADYLAMLPGDVRTVPESRFR